MKFATLSKMALFVTVVLGLLFATSSSQAQPQQLPSLKFAMVMDGSYITDAFLQTFVISYVETVRLLRQQGYHVQSAIEENIPADKVFDRFVYYQQEYKADIIFIPAAAHKAGYMKFVNTTMGAQQYFINGLGVGAGSPRSVALDNDFYQAIYIGGKACALTTKTKVVGMIPTLPGRATPGQLNAFIMGVRSINPRIEIVVMQNANFTNSGIVDRHIAIDMIDNYKVDCIMSGHNTPGSFEVTRDRVNTTTIAQFQDFRYRYGESVLFSIMFNWTTLNLQAIYGYLNDSFPGGEIIHGGIGSTVILSEYSTLVSDQLFEVLEATKQRIIDDRECIFPWTSVASLYPASEFNNTITLGNSTTRCLSDDQVIRMKLCLNNLITNPYNMTVEEAMKHLYVASNSPAAIAFYTLASLLILIHIALIPFVIRNRNLPLVKATSPEFMLIFILGCALMVSSIYTFYGEPTDIACGARVVLVFLGLTFILTPVFVKNFRIWRLFSNKTMDVFAISTRDLLLKGILPSLLTQVVILVIWFVTDPYKVVFDKSEPKLEEDEDYMRCASNLPVLFALEVVFIGILVVGNVFIGVLNRKLAYNLYKETQQISWITFGTLICGFIAFLGTYAQSYNVESEAILYSSLIIIHTLINLGSMFAERIVLVLKGKTDFHSASTTTITPTTSRSGPKHNTALTPYGTHRRASSAAAAATAHSSTASSSSPVLGKDDEL